MEAQRWLRQAEKDLESAKDSLTAKHYEWACFQAQQGSEKALKAFLYSRGLRAILTHSIRDLVIDCSRYDKGFKNYLPQARILDGFYISARYPNGLVGESIPAEYYSQEEADKCISYAALILSKVKESIEN